MVDLHGGRQHTSGRGVPGQRHERASRQGSKGWAVREGVRLRWLDTRVSLAMRIKAKKKRSMSLPPDSKGRPQQPILRDRAPGEARDIEGRREGQGARGWHFKRQIKGRAQSLLVTLTLAPDWEVNVGGLAECGTHAHEGEA